MKNLCFLLLLGATACTQQPTDHFILQGSVPGAMDSTKVTLRTITRWDKDLASAYVIDGKFELCGQLDAPTPVSYTHLYQSQDWFWSVSTSISKTFNKMKSKVDVDQYELSNFLNGSALVKGKPIGTFYSYKFIGLSPVNLSLIHIWIGL